MFCVLQRMCTVIVYLENHHARLPTVQEQVVLSCAENTYANICCRFEVLHSALFPFLEFECVDQTTVWIHQSQRACVCQYMAKQICVPVHRIGYLNIDQHHLHIHSWQFKHWSMCGTSQNTSRAGNVIQITQLTEYKHSLANVDNSSWA